MKIKLLLSLGIACVLLASIFAFNTTEPKSETCLSQKELDLYNAINDYRRSKGLANIPLSSSLTYVAQTHAYDLSYNRPFSSKCNMHSWSDKGKWSSCCYTSDHKQKECMWNKAREMTKYKGDIYEISHGYAQFDKFSGDTVTAFGALDGWKNSSGHNNVILNKDIWASTKWNAIGIGINRDFACVWFGKEIDEEKTPEECKKK
jgi:hypothetical protein